MNDKEKLAMDLTIKLWNALLDLDIEHKDDMREYQRDIHDIQNRIAARPALREMNSK